MKHTLDKKKIAEELHKRGWWIGSFNDYVVPLGQSKEQSEKDWEEAILAGIVCKDTNESVKL
jgi:hypothetical protein